MAKRPVRQIRIVGNVAYVPLTRGYEAIIDAIDADEIGKWNWTVATKPGKPTYAYRNKTVARQSFVSAKMHREILDAKQGQCVDHINGNGLDNRRANLRVVTFSQNAQNSSLRSNNASGFRGVSWRPNRMKWRARISLNGRQISLGHFDTKEEACVAYANAAAQLYAEYQRGPSCTS